MTSLGIIAIIDPDDYRHEIGQSLTEQGYLVETFADPEEALRRARETDDRPVGLILANVYLRTMNGAVLEEEVKKDSRLRHISLVFMSTRKPANGAPPGYRVLTKPIEDIPAFSDQVGLYLKSAHDALRDGRVENKLDNLSESLIAHMQSEAESRDKADEAIRSCAATSRNAVVVAGDALREASLAKGVANTAMAAAKEAATNVPDLGAVVNRTLEKTDPVIKWTVGAASGLIVSLATVALALAIYIASDTKSKVDVMVPTVNAFAGVQEEIKSDVKPTLKALQSRQDLQDTKLDGIQQGLSEVLKRIPKTKTTP